jgi:hypothetical protein
VGNWHEQCTGVAASAVADAPHHVGCRLCHYCRADARLSNAGGV